MKLQLMKYNFLLIAISFSAFTFSQDYEQLIKAKSGSFWGGSIKYLTDFESGYELLFHTNNQSFNFTALRVSQKPAMPENNSQWFFCYGYGTHAAFYHHYAIYNPFEPLDAPQKYNKKFMAIGFDGYAGLEYRFLKHPFVISLDFIPNFEFLGPDYFRVNLNNFCFGLAYVLK